jgi:predicted RNA polymerase sigma factor
LAAALQKSRAAIAAVDKTGVVLDTKTSGPHQSHRRAGGERAGAAAGAGAGGLELDGYRYLHSTRADFLRRLGRLDEARAAYQRALELATADPERRFLERRLRECSDR